MSTTTVDGLLAELTLEEKVSLVAGEDHWHTPPVERLGIPRFKMSDGPIGVRGARNPGGPRSACFPCGTALAATWDVSLIEEVGVHLGLEARAKGAHLLLGPTVNIHRHPLAGRNFECYSEDPYLTARTAVAYIDGVQSNGVGACIKHFVANDSEFERLTISSEVPERALREIYLRPFEVALAEAEPVAVMGAYNKLRGTWCCEHRWLLTGVLRDEWGYEGLVVSDWWATHTTSEAANAGLDIEMPGPPVYRGDALITAVRDGSVAEDVVDAMVRRLLVAMERTGALGGDVAEESEADTAERRALVRRAAAASMVLLKNDPVDGAVLLPLAADTLRRVAVIGHNADAVTILGGGSAAVSPYDVVSPLDALRERLAGVDIVYEPGGIATRYPPLLDMRYFSSLAGEGALALEYRSAGGEHEFRIPARRSQFDLSADPFGPSTEWTARISGEFVAPTDGEYRFQVSVAGGVRARIGAEEIADAWEPSRGRHERTVSLRQGEARELVVEFLPFPERRGSGLELRCERVPDEDRLERAVALAAEADLCIVVVGTNADTETEGRDRRSMELPGEQDEMVTRVAAANPRTVVVLNTGSPVTMPWVDDVPALLQMWFPGMEAGNALVEVLTGRRRPQGRLPTTFPKRIEDTPAYANYPGENGQVHYEEDIFVGYRWYEAKGIEPLFPFGHGLSYTTFDYGDVQLWSHEDGTVDVEIALTNVGDNEGVEIVQLYVATEEADRPPKELKAYLPVALRAGESGVAHFTLDGSAFARWDDDFSGWVEGRGAFSILVGSSSADIRARADLSR